LSQSDQSVVKLRSDDLAWRQVGDEVIVLDTNNSEYLSVNKTGSVLWELLLVGCTRADLARALAEHFQIDDTGASSDAENFVSSLEGLGLLENSQGE
jgi:hypothetical protein